MKSPATSFHHRSMRSAGCRGQTLVEYALILAFIAVVAIAVLMTMGVSVSSVFNTINVQLATAKQGSTGAAPGGRGGG